MPCYLVKRTYPGGLRIVVTEATGAYSAPRRVGGNRNAAPRACWTLPGSDETRRSCGRRRLVSWA